MDTCCTVLVLGMCFFAGGTRFSEQGFGIGAAQLNSSLLTISVIAVLLPAAFHLSLGNGNSDISSTVEGSDILKVSHGVSGFFEPVQTILFRRLHSSSGRPHSAFQ